MVMKTQRNENRKDIYQMVTDLILEKLENGIVPWKQNWSEMGAPANYVTKKDYRGINLWILLSLKHGIPYYLTFKQASALGGKIKKGSKGLPVCYWNYTFKHKITGKRLSEEEAKVVLPENLERSAYLKYYTVFNVSDTEGIDFKFPEINNSCEATTIEKCEQIINEMLLPPKIKSVKNFPYYSPKRDFINMPAMVQFKSPKSYYSVLFHELVHATGHPKRLNRPEIANFNPYGSEAYSREELTAEMGAGFLNNYSGILSEDLIDDSASYIDGWLKVLKNDKKLILEAAGKAQKAVDYILDTSPF